MKKETNPTEAEAQTTTQTVTQKVESFAQSLLLMRRIQDKADAIFLASLGNLNLQQLSVLNAIGDHRLITMGDIAKQVSLSLSSVTLIIDKLYKLRLVKRIRDRNDRRIVRACLTEEGEKIYQVQVHHLQDVIKKIFQLLNEKEQDMLVSIFSKLTTLWNLGMEDPEKRVSKL